MKELVIIIAAIAATQALVPQNAGLRVRFDMDPLGFGTTSYISRPRTVSEAKNERWVETLRPEGPLPSLVIFCPSNTDRTVCCLYDDTGYIAGLQIALPTDLFTSTSGLDLKTLGFTLWTPPVSSGTLRSYWTAQMYFVDEAFLEISAEERIAARNDDKTIQGEYIWVSGFDGKRMAIYTDGNEVADTANSLYTRQECFIMQGRHYYYKMTPQMPCDSNTMFPWFPLVHSGELVGIGFYTFGKLDPQGLARDYFERPSRQAVEYVISSGPQCLYELIDSAGLVVMHTYFVDTPWVLTCDGQ